MKLKLLVNFTMLFCFSQVILAQNYGNWHYVDTIKFKLRDHASILLPDGNVLVTGGLRVGGISKNCEIFNVANEKWESVNGFNRPRSYHNLVMLNNGKIMAIGGYYENSCEILCDNKWVTADTFALKRIYGQSSIVLNNGDVLLIGGVTDYPVTKKITTLDDCQVFDSNKLKWRLTGKLNIPRDYNTTTKLLDGRVLVTGGYSIGGVFTNTCEIYDPISEKWTITDTLKENRAKHGAILLKDGKVLVFGGYRTTTEMFDPVKEKWSTVGYAPAAEVKGAVINNGEYILYIDGPTKYSCGWGIISLKDYSRKYFKLFGKWIYAQSFTKINEEKALMTGGMEIKEDGFSYSIVNKAMLYDYNLTNIEISEEGSTRDETVSINCYPNPFNSNTVFTFELPENGNVKVQLYDILGREIKKIAAGYYFKGKHTINFNAPDLSSGVYMCVLKYDSKYFSRKIILMK